MLWTSEMSITVNLLPSIEAMDIATWDRMIAIHLCGSFMVTHLVLTMLHEQNYGKIINTASQLAYAGAPVYAHYTAAKAKIIAFTRFVALEIGTRGVTEELLEAIRQSIPKGRFAQVAEIVPSYVLLASHDSDFYQGRCLSPNGGDVFFIAAWLWPLSVDNFLLHRMTWTRLTTKEIDQLTRSDLFCGEEFTQLCC